MANSAADITVNQYIKQPLQSHYNLFFHSPRIVGAIPLICLVASHCIEIWRYTIRATDSIGFELCIHVYFQHIVRVDRRTANRIHRSQTN